MKIKLDLLMRRIILLLGLKSSKEIFYEEYKDKIRRLIKRGLKIGKNVTIEDTVFFDSGYPYLISIGDNCSIAGYVRLLCHDDTLYKYNGGYARIGKIEIKDNCFIGERSIILPGVTIGPNALVAAGSLVNKNVPENSCIAGVPARVYAKFDDMVKRQVDLIKQRPVFSYDELRTSAYMDPALQRDVVKSVQDGFSFVKGKSGENYKMITWNAS